MTAAMWRDLTALLAEVARDSDTRVLVLSGDAVHFKSNWENRGVPVGNFGQEQTRDSMKKMADLLASEKAQLWINHDKAQRDTLTMAPDFYE